MAWWIGDCTNLLVTVKEHLLFRIKHPLQTDTRLFCASCSMHGKLEAQNHERSQSTSGLGCLSSQFPWWRRTSSLFLHCHRTLEILLSTIEILVYTFSVIPSPFSSICCLFHPFAVNWGVGLGANSSFHTSVNIIWMEKGTEWHWRYKPNFYSTEGNS